MAVATIGLLLMQGPTDPAMGGHVPNRTGVRKQRGSYRPDLRLPLTCHAPTYLNVCSLRQGTSSQSTFLLKLCSLFTGELAATLAYGSATS